MPPYHSNALRVYGQEFPRFPPRLGEPAQSLPHEFPPQPNAHRTYEPHWQGRGTRKRDGDGASFNIQEAIFQTLVRGLRTVYTNWAEGSSEPASKATYNTTNHNYGTAYNITHLENATFADSSSSPRYNGTTRTPSPDRSKKRSSSSPSTPPHSFIMFGLTYLRTQYEAETVQLGEAGVYAVISDAWNLISPEDRAKIEGDSECAEELHTAMVQRCWEARIKGPEVRGRDKKAGTSRGE